MMSKYSAIGLVLFFSSSLRASTIVDIVENGYVTESPLWEYRGHGYLYDNVPGDNHMPWLRDYAASHDIFDDIDLTAEWKDREWEMIKAIIRFTSEGFSWTGSNTVPQGYKAKIILENRDANPDWHWGCGTISCAAIGLAQAHGIPARLTGGQSAYGFGNDQTCEMYSTRFNRWIHVHPHGGQWIEDHRGPLGIAELREYDLAFGILVDRVILGDDSVPSSYYEAIPYPPLAFHPSNNSSAPRDPFISTKFWSGYFWYMRVWYRWQPNAPTSGQIKNIVTHDFLNESYSVPRPIVPVNDPGLTYPLNNVEAVVLDFDSDSASISLTNNIHEPVGYEYRVDGGLWMPLVAPNGEFEWAFTVPSTLEIRGLDLSGAHSPDVVIKSFSIDENQLAACIAGPNAAPSPSCSVEFDFDGDGDVDLKDYSIASIAP